MSVSSNRPAPTQPLDAASDNAVADGSMLEPDGDVQRIERVLQGDSDAFDELVQQYAPRLVRMAYALVGNREDAEDLAQEALAKAYFKLDSFAGRSSFFTWLYRITVNLSISKRRKRRIESTHHAVALDDAPPPITEQQGVDRIETEEQLDRLRLAITQLEEDRRSVLVLRDVEGMDYGEIAEILNIPKGTVRSRLHRARGDLKDIMSISPPPSPKQSDE